jgi:hypothetical protein
VGGAPGGFPIGLAVTGAAELEEIVAEEAQEERQGGDQENEAEDEQDAADDLAHGMAEAHGCAVKRTEGNRANEGQHEQSGEGEENRLHGQVRDPGATPEQAGDEGQEEGGGGGEFLPFARAVIEFEPHGCRGVWGQSRADFQLGFWFCIGAMRTVWLRP